MKDRLTIYAVILVVAIIGGWIYSLKQELREARLKRTNEIASQIKLNEDERKRYQVRIDSLSTAISRQKQNIAKLTIQLNEQKQISDEYYQRWSQYKIDPNDTLVSQLLDYLRKVAGSTEPDTSPINP